MAGDRFDCARRVVDVVAATVGCRVDRISIGFIADAMQVVIVDQGFRGRIDVSALSKAICGGFGDRLRYCGPVAHEGGIVTIEISRCADGAELRVSEAG